MARMDDLPTELKTAIMMAVSNLRPQGESLPSGGDDLASLRSVDRQWHALVSPLYFKVAQLDYKDLGALDRYLAFIAPRNGQHVRILTFGSDHSPDPTPPIKERRRAMERVDIAAEIVQSLPNLVDVDLELGLDARLGADDSRLLDVLPNKLLKLHLSGTEFRLADSQIVAKLLGRLPELRTLNLRDVDGWLPGGMNSRLYLAHIAELQDAIRSLKHLKVLQFESVSCCNSDLLVDSWRAPITTLNIYHCDRLSLLDFQRLAHNFRDTLRNIFLLDGSSLSVPDHLPPFVLPHLNDLRIESYCDLSLIHAFDSCPLRYLFVRLVNGDGDDKPEPNVLSVLKAHQATFRLFKLATEDPSGEVITRPLTSEEAAFCKLHGIDLELGHWDAWEDPGLHG